MLNKVSHNRMLDSVVICPLSYKSKSCFYLTYDYYQYSIRKSCIFILLTQNFQNAHSNLCLLNSLMILPTYWKYSFPVECLYQISIPNTSSIPNIYTNIFIPISIPKQFTEKSNYINRNRHKNYQGFRCLSKGFTCTHMVACGNKFMNGCNLKTRKLYGVSEWLS